jgi:hypothetical protein
VLLPSDTGDISLPLQLFYFHLWPIYWLSLVDSHKPSIIHTYTYRDVFLKYNVFLILMTYIREIFHSNLGRYPVFPDRNILLLPSVFASVCRDSGSN